MIDDDVLEGTYINGIEADSVESLNARVSAPKLRGNKIDARDLNVTKRACQLGINPIDTLLLIVAGDHAALGSEEPVRIHEMRQAASSLMEYIQPKLKAAEAEEDIEKLKPLPLFAPKRGQKERSLEHKEKEPDDNNS